MLVNFLEPTSISNVLWFFWKIKKINKSGMRGRYLRMISFLRFPLNWDKPLIFLVSLKWQENKEKISFNNLVFKARFLGFPGGAVWLRICLPVQGTLVWEDLTCRRAPKPASHNYWSPRATTTEARVPRARAPQEKPPQWGARAL